MKGRQPPNQNLRDLLLRVIEKGESDLIEGHQKMNDRIKAAHPHAGIPKRSQKIPLPKSLEPEWARLKSRNYANRVLLAGGDFLRQTVIDTTASGVVNVTSKDGHLQPVVIRAPSDANLKTAVRQMAAAMNGANKERDELIPQADAMEAFYLLDWDLHKWEAFDIESGRFNKTLQVLDTVLDVLDQPLYAAKHWLNVPRPHVVEMDIEVVPWLPVPQHQSLPSGHAAAATALERVLSDLTGADADAKQKRRLEGIAVRIARNRERAGLHTDLDTAAGVDLGGKIAGWMVGRALAGDTAYASWSALYAQASAEWV